MLQCIGDKAESRIIENLLLHTKHDPQGGLRTHFAQCTEEFQIQNDFPFISGRQIREEFINDNQITLVRILLREGHHHIFDYRFYTFYAAVFRNIKVNAAFLKVFLNVSHDDIVQRHYDAADLNAQNFKLSCNRLHLLRKLFVLEILNVISIRSNSGDNTHQMGFTSTIVTDNQNALIVYHFIHLELVNHWGLKALSHRVGHYIGFHIFACLILVIRRHKLNDILNRMKRNQI